MTSRRNLLKGFAAALTHGIYARPVLAAPAICRAAKFKAMMGDYPHTHALLTGAVSSPCVSLEIAPVKAPATAFARAVAMEFDVSELALVTFLMAKAQGRRLVLLPAVNLSRFQHPYLVYNSERGLVTPKDLERARIGTRLFTATTATWLRGILADDYGVDVKRIQWLAWQQPNVPEFRDPPNVRRIGETDLADLLRKGEVDAIIADPVPADPRFKPVIANPDAAANAWAAKHHAIQINHMVVVKEELVKSNAEGIRELWRMMREAKRMAGPEGHPEYTPFGLAENRHNIEIAIDYVYRTGTIPRRFAVDELFDEVTAELA
jgi:4,5-dihydroxyphthalate decarboxylase